MTDKRLSEILNSRTKRVQRQAKVLAFGQCSCVLCLTVNMPGENKQNRWAKDFFSSAVLLVKSTFSAFILKDEIHPYCAAGPEYIAALSGDAVLMKKVAIETEEMHPWTRMLDIDIIGKNGSSLSRVIPRKCLVCGNNAKECARSRAHSDKEVINSIALLHKDCRARHFADLAYESLIAELNCTPKPGLVDKNNSGSHSDMDYALMKKSAETLHPWFYEMAMSEDFVSLREIGKKAETAMLSATGGVNTHKGAIFCMGILCYCAMHLKNPTPSALSSAVRKTCAGITAELEVSGSEVYRRYGLTGARGQAEKGYADAVFLALPFFRSQPEKCDENLALARTLLYLVSIVPDTNIVMRTDMQTLKWAQSECSALLEGTEEEIRALDAKFVSRGISPGGCADLLAVTYFLSNI